NAEQSCRRVFQNGAGPKEFAALQDYVLCHLHWKYKRPGQWCAIGRARLPCRGNPCIESQSPPSLRPEVSCCRDNLVRNGNRHSACLSADGCPCSVQEPHLVGCGP